MAEDRVCPNCGGVASVVNTACASYGYQYRRYRNLPKRSEWQAGRPKTDTVYIEKGKGATLGYNVGEGHDAYGVWEYTANRLTTFPYTEAGLEEPRRAFAAAESAHNTRLTASQRRWSSAALSVTGCTYLGWHGYSHLPSGARCHLRFDREGLLVAVGAPVPKPVIAVPYGQIAEIRLGGPGAVKTGGGFIGGGFGLAGFAEGALMAGALNSLTTRTRIQTTIAVHGTDGEMFFFYSGETATDLRVRLSVVFGALKRVHAKRVPPPPPPPPALPSPPPASTDSLQRLAELARLVETGILTQAEFEEAKAKVLRSP